MQTWWDFSGNFSTDTNEIALTLLQVDQNQASPMLLHPNHDYIKRIKLQLLDSVLFT